MRRKGVSHALGATFPLKQFSDQDHISAAWIWTRIRRIGRSRKSMFEEELGYLEGGSEILVETLMNAIEARGGVVNLGNAAKRVLTDGHRVTGVETASGVSLADAVISTVPTPYVSALIPDLPEADKKRYDAIPNIGICCLIFKLKRSLSPHFWVNLSEDRLSIPGLIEFSNLRPVSESIVYVPYYMPVTQEKFSWPDETLLAEAFQAMQAVNPQLREDDVIDKKVARLRYAQPICPPGFASIASACPDGNHGTSGSRYLLLLPRGSRYRRKCTARSTHGTAGGAVRRVKPSRSGRRHLIGFAAELTGVTLLSVKRIQH